MKYLVDTVALNRHFTRNKSIGKQAREILSNPDENVFYISIVSLMEILYLSEKNRIDISLKETLRRINAKESYQIVELDAEILQVAETVPFPELHDRLILATAKWLEVPIISSDMDFQNVEGITTIWK